MNSEALKSMANGGYSRANRNSFYNKQRQNFEKNIKHYDQAKEIHIHKHVREITEMFKSLIQTPPTKVKSLR